MRSPIAFFAVLVASPFSLTFATAEQPPPHHVMVAGTAIVKVAPDEMQWSLQITINDATMARAKARHDASLATALKYIGSLGAGAKDLQTGGIRFDRDTDSSTSFLRHNPYRCSTGVTFTLIDFEKYGPASDALAGIDGCHVDSVGYSSSKEVALRRDALRRALLDGQSKAKELAETAGCRIDKPLSIDEQEAWMVRPEMMNSSLATGDTSSRSFSSRTPSAVGGQIEFDAKVIVSYELLAP